MEQFKRYYQEDLDKIILSEEADHRILSDLIEASHMGAGSGKKAFTEKKREKSNKWMKNAVAAVLGIVILGSAGTLVNAATNGKVVEWVEQLFGAEQVSIENESLIGQEVVDNSVPEVVHGEKNSTGNQAENIFEGSHIVKSFANEEIVEPLSITEFEVTDNSTPEIIMTNGSMAVFYKNDYDGWDCKTGDTISFNFEKYESEVIQDQTLVIGYIRDGVVYQGKAFKELKGSYEMIADEDGTYNLYVISATSDYLTLKQGSINIIYGGCEK